MKDIEHSLYYVAYILYYVLYISYYVFDEYSLVIVLNRMSKRLKSVTKKLFGGKSSSRALSTDTLFQGCSTAGRRRAEMMRHMNPSLVEDTSDDGGQDPKEEEEEEEELELQQEDEVVGGDGSASGSASSC
jgi:hypothetical protein